MKIDTRIRGLVISTVLVAGACGSPSSSEGTQAASTSSPFMVYAGSDAFPYSTLEEVRTFSDAWVRVVVTSERFGELEGDPEGTEGYRPRKVTLRVDETLWARPGFDPPAELELETGIAVSKGVEVPMIAEGGTDLEVDGTYLIGLLDYDGKVDLPSPRAIRRIEDGVLQAPDVPVDDVMSRNTGDPESYVQAIAAAAPLVPDSVADPDDRLRTWSAQMAEAE